MPKKQLIPVMDSFIIDSIQAVLEKEPLGDSFHSGIFNNHAFVGAGEQGLVSSLSRPVFSSEGDVFAQGEQISQPYLFQLNTDMRLLEVKNVARRLQSDRKGFLRVQTVREALSLMHGYEQLLERRALCPDFPLVLLGPSCLPYFFFKKQKILIEDKVLLAETVYLFPRGDRHVFSAGPRHRFPKGALIILLEGVFPERYDN